MAATFTVSVVTPERMVVETEARFAAVPAWDGEIGFLARRAPIVIKVGIGRLRIQTPGEELVFFVAGGFAQMVDDRLTILTQEALRAEEIDRRVAERALAEARAMTVTDDASHLARQEALERARVQLRLAG
jgi:F-type H+-transporting ATPase subunit epsilon